MDPFTRFGVSRALRALREVMRDNTGSMSPRSLFVILILALVLLLLYFAAAKWLVPLFPWLEGFFKPF